MLKLFKIYTHFSDFAHSPLKFYGVQVIPDHCVNCNTSEKLNFWRIPHSTKIILSQDIFNYYYSGIYYIYSGYILFYEIT